MFRICVVGAGFGGLHAALHLEEALSGRRHVEVTLINDGEFFSYTPLIPHVATGSLSSRSTQLRIPATLQSERIKVLNTRAREFDFEAERVHHDLGSSRYDYLLLAPGTEPNDAKVPGAREHAFALHTIRDALRLKGRVLNAFKQAELSNWTDAELLAALTFVIVGGGASGVELAAELMCGIEDSIIPHVSPRIRNAFRVILVEAEETLLPRFPKLQDVANETCRQIGVDVRTGTRVTEVDAQSCSLDSGDRIASQNTIWVGGLRAPRWLENKGIPLHDNGQIAVNASLEVDDLDGVFAVGGAVYFEQDGRPLLMTPQVAAQQGVRAAGNIAKDLIGASHERFRYVHLGDYISLGRGRAAMSLGPIRLSGLGGWTAFQAYHAAVAPTLTKKLAIFADATEKLLRGRDWGRLMLIQ